jgi:arylsulfatase
VAALLALAFPALAAAPIAPDRTSLPLREPAAPTITTVDVRDATPPPRFRVKAPDGAPNVVIVLLDDVGFGQTSTFGGPVATPTLDRLASEGLRYTQFHTTSLCSPTRAALLTGRNHHSVNMGSIVETATAFPGDTSVRPQDVTPLAEILRLNGFATAAFGKSHETPAWEVTGTGPFDRWPSHSGFETFYGFVGGETNQWSPLVYDGTTRVDPPKDPDYHFTVDMTDHAIAWLQAEHTDDPDQPFFLYFATGAAHAPHQAPKPWIDRYAGAFDDGWDVMRAETLAGQKALGVVPPDTVLAPKPAAVPDWDTLSADEKRLYAREMEVFAGYLSHADDQIGRLVATLEELGELDDTLLVFVVGDNGASAEGTAHGLFNENTYFNGVEETVPEVLARIDELGGPYAYNHYAAGWAVAGDTPFAWTKQVASDWGGTRNGMVVRYPRGIHEPGGVRTQWHHVIDVAPTVLEVAGVPQPKTVDGIPQHPIEGVSLAYTFDAPDAPSRHTTQYFEMFGNRAIYHDGWLARTIHAEPWNPGPDHPLADDVWSLYDTRADFSLVHDLAAANPEKLKELQALFLKEAAAHHVLPIDDRRLERFDAVAVGRPDPMAGRTSLTLTGDRVGLVENAFLSVKNRSFTIEADVDLAADASDGAIVVQGGRFGGWSLYLHEGRPAFTYNWVGLEHYDVVGDAPLAPGRHELGLVFDYDGGGRGQGGVAHLLVDGAPVAMGRVEHTNAFAFGIDETADVGTDLGTPVSEAYAAHPAFPGRIERVTLEVGPLGGEAPVRTTSTP